VAQKPALAGFGVPQNVQNIRPRTPVAASGVVATDILAPIHPNRGRVHSPIKCGALTLA
jgi:hypothetical protein